MRELIVRVAAKALIRNERDEILVLREAESYADGTNIGKWGVPGGRLRPGESYTDALLREVKEETSLTVSIGEPVFVDEWRPLINGVRYQIVGIYSTCSVDSGTVALSDEHDEYRWIRREDVSGLTIMPHDIEAIRISFETD